MAEKKIKTRGLGRGLSTLMADVEADTFLKPAAGRVANMALPIEKIQPNPNQPRRQFTEADLADLAASIRAKGVIQPLIVRKSPKTAEMYEIVAGERRWRAAQMVQLHELPVLIREFNDTEVLEVAIIENIQRADLNPIEEAAGYRQLMDKFGHTQEKLADALGKSRSYIANLLRLLHLPEEVLDLLRSGTLTAGHARALITSDMPGDLARQVVAGGLSVRATEALVKKAAAGEQATAQVSAAPRARSSTKDADTKALEGDLSASLGLKVSVEHQAGSESGQIIVNYTTLEQLDDICRILSRP
ncbi:ParB/RepB/Spo0J family partition protein [Paracoccaceae bacterium]|jgi:ParB family transcriptional regulator, chromosome partitioning protein|nr:ParB/RepB/Spo0J family partition protein [Paracoccaceae bacterium]